MRSLRKLSGVAFKSIRAFGDTSNRRIAPRFVVSVLVLFCILLSGCGAVSVSAFFDSGAAGTTTISGTVSIGASYFRKRRQGQLNYGHSGYIAATQRCARPDILRIASQPVSDEFVCDC
jgi:hypothetical protein